MIQYNLSFFIEHQIEEDAIIALKRIILPELQKFEFIKQLYLFEIQSHQEPDSKGLSLQCWLEEINHQESKEIIEQIVSSFFAAEFPNKFVYFPSELKLIHSN